MCLLFICVTGSAAKLLMMLSLLMQLLVVVDTAVLMMVIEASACSEDRQTCGMREGRDVMWGGRDGGEGEMVGARTFCWCYFIKRWRRSPCVEEWKLLGDECSVKRLYLPHQISPSVCKARDTQRPCSHAGHSHFQGHCQIVQFIISVSTYVHGHRLYTVKPRCLLTSAIVDFFSEKKNCLGFHRLPWISPSADFAKTKSDPPVVLPGVPPVWTSPCTCSQTIPLLSSVFVLVYW